MDPVWLKMSNYWNSSTIIFELFHIACPFIDVYLSFALLVIKCMATHTPDSILYNGGYIERFFFGVATFCTSKNSTNTAFCFYISDLFSIFFRYLTFKPIRGAHCETTNIILTVYIFELFFTLCLKNLYCVL